MKLGQNVCIEGMIGRNEAYFQRLSANSKELWYKQHACQQMCIPQQF